MVQRGIAIELVPWRPIFEKCSHLREKGGGADAQNTPLGLRLPLQYVRKKGSFRNP
jgi:hypothetical protein